MTRRRRRLHRQARGANIYGQSVEIPDDYVTVVCVQCRRVGYVAPGKFPGPDVVAICPACMGLPDDEH